MGTPSKRQYEEALDIVAKYEKRQKELKSLNNDLGFHLRQFNSFKFDVNKGKREVTFAGTTKNGQIKLSKAVAHHDDKFDITIGKLVAVLKALKQDVSFIDKYIEREIAAVHLRDYVKRTPDGLSFSCVTDK